MKVARAGTTVHAGPGLIPRRTLTSASKDRLVTIPRVAFVDEPLVYVLGDRIRKARIAARRSQRDVAARAGVSPTMLCRIELGHGGSVPLDAWAAVARVLEVEIAAEIREPCTSFRGQIELRCHGLITALAQTGGWVATTEIVRTDRRYAPSSVDTVLVRPYRKEAALVHAWHPALDVNLALGALEAGSDRLQRGHGPGWVVSVLVICPSTTENRRRIGARVPDLAPVLPAMASEWMMALRSTRSPMPTGGGLLWTDRWAIRFRPALKRPGWERGA